MSKVSVLVVDDATFIRDLVKKGYVLVNCCKA